MLKFRIGKIVSFIPKFEISVGRPSFYAGVEFHLVLWSRGVSFTITTKKIYQAYLDKMKQNMERIEREKANPPT